MMKSLLQRLGGSQGHLLLHLLGRLTSITVVGDEQGRRMLDARQNCLVACWHGKMLLPIYYLRRRGVWALVSMHSDGEVIAGVLQKLGFHCVRGSSTRGGNVARQQLQEKLSEDQTVLITPDGPTGPRQKMKAGAVVTAQRSGVPVLPLSFTSTRLHQFGSWDRFTIWKPFSRTCLLVGEPITITPEMSVEDGINLVEMRMLQLEEECNHLNC
jgi:lysophospholipid acyltransferase (LPLAT)-like uncharacterized protein